MMPIWRRQRTLWVAALLTLGLCISLWSSGLAASGSEAAAHDGGQGLDLLYRFINFALLVIILFVVVRKTPIKDFFSSRREEIKRRLEDLERDRKASEDRYRALERKLSESEKQRDELMAQYKAEGLAEKEKIVAAARVKAQEILKQADLAIKREIDAAKQRLRNEVAEVATQKARQILQKEIRENDQDRLVDDFVERVGKLN
jgi:F-type H+-transporting ATPase subunit b